MQQAPVRQLIGSIRSQIPSLRRYARAWLRDRQIADRVVRDCLERALSTLHLVGSNTDLRTWLFGLLHDAQLHDAQARRAAGAMSNADSRDEGYGTGNPESAGGEPSRDTRLFRLAFERLSADERQILLLTGLEGLSARESAQVLQIPTAAAMARIGRARQRLRSLQAEANTLSAATAESVVSLYRVQQRLPA